MCSHVCAICIFCRRESPWKEDRNNQSVIDSQTDKFSTVLGSTSGQLQNLQYFSNPSISFASLNYQHLFFNCFNEMDVPSVGKRDPEEHWAEFSVVLGSTSRQLQKLQRFRSRLLQFQHGLSVRWTVLSRSSSIFSWFLFLSNFLMQWILLVFQVLASVNKWFVLSESKIASAIMAIFTNR